MIVLVTSRLLCFAILVDTAFTSGPYQSLGDIFQGQLANLEPNPPGNPALGGQNFGHCCKVAVNESLEIIDGYLQFRDGQTALHGNVSSFLANQFPCKASYNGSAGDQPQVTVSYTWCHDHCDGWAKKSTKIQSDWIEPLVGYILPTIVFCFSVPRRREIIIPPGLFPSSRLFRFPENLTLLYKIPAATLLTILDTLLWVATCIVLSGPMLLSGFLEVLADSRLLNFLSSERGLSVKQKAHLLLIALIGNLDEEPAWGHSVKLVSSLDDRPASSQPSSIKHGVQQPGIDWRPIDGFSDQDLPSGSNTIITLTRRTAPLPYIGIMKSRLTSLLESQNSFATSVGIGVIFFASSFFYGIGDIKASYGANATSYSLAFGCFWMTIGHVAVIAGMLLAGNNPSCWEGIAAHPDHISEVALNTGPPSKPRSGSVANQIRHWSESSIRRRRFRLPSGLKRILYKSGFASKYKTAWMWNRGSRKAMWIARFAEEYNVPELQTEVLYMGWKEWLFATTVPTLLLFLIPTFLGGMASYTTPTIGLSCRSMVPLMYSSTQTMLVLLWLCDWRFWKRTPEMKVLTFRQVQELRKRSLSGLEVFWYFIYMLTIIGATVFAIGGTTFQLMGLFGNCLCYIPIWSWANRWSPAVTMYLSDNSTEQIYYAKTYWIPIAVSAVVFLVVATYFGWQYQNRIRREYLHLVDNIDSIRDPEIEAKIDSEGELRIMAPSKQAQILAEERSTHFEHSTEIVGVENDAVQETGSTETVT